MKIDWLMAASEGCLPSTRLDVSMVGDVCKPSVRFGSRMTVRFGVFTMATLLGAGGGTMERTLKVWIPGGGGGEHVVGAWCCGGIGDIVR